MAVCYQLATKMFAIGRYWAELRDENPGHILKQINSLRYNSALGETAV